MYLYIYPPTENPLCGGGGSAETPNVSIHLAMHPSNYLPIYPSTNILIIMVSLLLCPTHIRDSLIVGKYIGICFWGEQQRFPSAAWGSLQQRFLSIPLPILSYPILSIDIQRDTPLWGGWQRFLSIDLSVHPSENRESLNIGGHSRYFYLCIDIQKHNPAQQRFLSIHLSIWSNLIKSNLPGQK